MINVLVNGACGRMGQAVLKAVTEDAELNLVAAVDIVSGKFNDIEIETDLKKAISEKKPQVMVDFTRPDVVFENAKIALNLKVAPVIGTTGLTDENKNELKKLSEANDTPIFIAPNFAIGAVLMMLMSKQAAKYLPNVEIIEMHHDKKLDAPSGTAIQTAEMIKEVRSGMKQGHPDEKEKLAGARGAEVDGMHIHSVRLPGFVAHQQVIFGGLGETLTIRHDSLDRASFMPGVVLACKKVLGLKGLTVGLDKIM